MVQAPLAPALFRRSGFGGKVDYDDAPVAQTEAGRRPRVGRWQLQAAAPAVALLEARDHGGGARSPGRGGLHSFVHCPYSLQFDTEAPNVC
jgi:hypothetical protein